MLSWPRVKTACGSDCMWHAFRWHCCHAGFSLLVASDAPILLPGQKLARICPEPQTCLTYLIRDDWTHEGGEAAAALMVDAQVKQHVLGGGWDVQRVSE